MTTDGEVPRRNEWAEVVEIHGMHESQEGHCRWGFALWVSKGFLLPQMYLTREAASKDAEGMGFLVL